MKLAICSVGELFGGVERHILGMSTWLKREGHEFVLILFHDRELARQARLIGVKPVILKTRGSFDLGAPRKLARILAEHRVNVVHAHGYRAVVNCALARRDFEFAMVRTVHGLVESSGWSSVKGAKGRMFTLLERYFGRRANAAVAYVTDDLRRKHTQHDRGLLTVTIHNGIEPLKKQDYSRPLDLKPGYFHLAAVGRVTRIKGLEYAIRALVAVDPGLRVYLNIIGNGPLEGDLEDLARELGVAERVRFLGFKENVFDYLAHLDVLIMPSLHEGLPYTILEAMSLGVPIIASRVGGMAEVLEDGATAILVRPTDVKGLGDSMTAARSHPEALEKYGQEAKRVQASRYNLANMGSAYWALYGALPGQG